MILIQIGYIETSNFSSTIVIVLKQLVLTFEKSLSVEKEINDFESRTQSIVIGLIYISFLWQYVQTLFATRK